MSFDFELFIHLLVEVFLFAFCILVACLVDGVARSLLIVLLEEACLPFEFVHRVRFDVAHWVLQGTQQLELLF